MIKYTVQDNAGTVTNIVLGDVTGESWFMVLAMASEIRRMKKWQFSGICCAPPLGRGKAGGKHIPCTHAAARSGRCTDCSPQRVLNRCKIVNTSLDTIKLTLIDTVKSSAFDGSSGVRTKDGYYELAENIGVYISEQNRFVSLQTAKSTTRASAYMPIKRRKTAGKSV